MQNADYDIIIDNIAADIRSDISLPHYLNFNINYLYEMLKAPNKVSRAAS